MSLKGFDQLRKHIPELNTPLGLVRLFAVPLLLYFLATALFSATDRLPPFWLVAIVVSVEAIGFTWLHLFFRIRNDFKARYGPLAYSRAVSLFAYPAGGMIVSVVARIANIPGPAIARLAFYPVLSILGWLLIVAGLWFFARTLQTFGVDNLTLLYVYVPEESQLVDRKIYEVLRHPAYAAAQIVVLGLALRNGNWLALISALCFMIGLWGWVLLVEEQELLERFGSSYAEYRRRVPAFWPRPRDLGKLFRFLLIGS
jgi:protein-S-isoprenylcysteine O-methyltransferase Ste14